MRAIDVVSVALPIAGASVMVLPTLDSEALLDKDDEALTEVADESTSEDVAVADSELVAPIEPKTSLILPASDVAG